MPKKVDHTARRESLAKAAVEAIDRAGLDAVRLVDVAAAAKVTTGAVVHYLPNKDAVLLAAFERVGKANLERIAASRGRTITERALLYLPHDEETSREWRVFLQFWGRGVSDPVFREKHREGYEAIAATLKAELDATGMTDTQTLADATIAAVDGVAVRVAMEPEQWPEPRMRATLSALLVPLYAAHDINADEIDRESA